MEFTLEEYIALYHAINDRMIYFSDEKKKGELLTFEATQWTALNRAYLKLKKQASLNSTVTNWWREV